MSRDWPDDSVEDVQELLDEAKELLEVSELMGEDATRESLIVFIDAVACGDAHRAGIAVLMLDIVARRSDIGGGPLSALLHRAHRTLPSSSWPTTIEMLLFVKSWLQIKQDFPVQSKAHKCVWRLERQFDQLKCVTDEE